MIDIESYRLEYKSFNLNDKRIQDEYSLINESLFLHDDDDPEWNSLTNEEKQMKRLLTLKNVKKTLTKENKDFFRFEDSIIDLYEALKLCINSLLSHKDQFINKEVFVRLSIMLHIEILYINIYRDVRRINNLNYSVIKLLIYDSLNSIDENLYLEDSSILFLESKLDIAYFLFSEKMGH